MVERFEQMWNPDKVEVTLMSKRTVNVFQIPPMASAKGHCSQDWSGKQMWTGSCRVMSELGTKCKVQLVNEDGTIFAQSIITDGDNYETHVQRTYDSTRAFSLVLVSDKGEKATIGLIFPERNDSFDLVHALDEYKKAYRLDKGLDKHVEKKVVQKDFSLQEGEKMTLTIEGVTRKDAEPAQKKQATGLKKLAAPKGFKPKSQGLAGMSQSGSTTADSLIQIDHGQPSSNQAQGLDALLAVSEPQSDVVALLDQPSSSLQSFQPQASNGILDIDFSAPVETADPLLAITQSQSTDQDKNKDFDDVFGI